MRQHRDQVGRRLRIDRSFHKVMKWPRHSRKLASRCSSLSMIPPGVGVAVRSDQYAEHPPVFERKVEQSRQHLAGQLDRDLVDEVEGLAARQLVERVAHAAADQPSTGEVLGRDDRLHHLALRVVHRRIHGDEHRQLKLAKAVAEHDAAQGRTRREPPVVRFEGDDVLVFGDRPMRPADFPCSTGPAPRVGAGGSKAARRRPDTKRGC